MTTAPYTIGIDIGGTKLSAALIAPDYEILAFEHRATPAEPEPFVDALLGLVGALRHNAGSPATAIGIATAGVVNTETGEILGATGNLPALRGIRSLKRSLEEATGLPVHLENDANAAAYGERVAGAGEGADDVLMITLGTGVGVGIVVGGQLVRGAHWSAGEGGHIAISMNHERLCTCGRWDCWETYASGTGLAETARRMLHATPGAEHTRLMRGVPSLEGVTTHHVIAAWQEGDALATEMLSAWHQHIATGLGSLLNVLDPERVVVGGGMAQFVDFEKLTTLTRVRAMTPEITLVPATLGNQAGLVGAVALARKVGANCLVSP